MKSNFETKFDFLNLVSGNIVHHAVLLPQIYAMENCKLLLECIAWKQGKSVEQVLSSPDNLFFTKFSENEVPLKVGDQAKWNSGARLIIKFAQNTSFSGEKIIIIEEIDSASRQALNALLKIIEEPPKGTTFYLIYGNLKNVIETVRSRCYVVHERIDCEEKFSKLADFFGFENNYDKFCEVGYNFDAYLGNNLTISQILQKLTQGTMDEAFAENAMMAIEAELCRKMLNVKSFAEMEVIEELRSRFNKLKKACDGLNTSKYSSLAELTERLYAVDF